MIKISYKIKLKYTKYIYGKKNSIEEFIFFKRVHLFNTCNEHQNVMFHGKEPEYKSFFFSTSNNIEMTKQQRCPYVAFSSEVKSIAQLQTRDRFTLVIGYEL
jgi:hypothetical protein